MKKKFLYRTVICFVVFLVCVCGILLYSNRRNYNRTIDEIDNYTKELSRSTADHVRDVFMDKMAAIDSIAYLYALSTEGSEADIELLVELEQITGKRWDKLYIVGGGAKNDFLNRLTELATGKKVIALPIEATALGNIKIQMEADK